MRAVIQRVSHASVTIDEQIKSQIEQGYLILLGICEEDSMEDVDCKTISFIFYSFFIFPLIGLILRLHVVELFP